MLKKIISIFFLLTVPLISQIKIATTLHPFKVIIQKVAGDRGEEPPAAGAGGGGALHVAGVVAGACDVAPGEGDSRHAGDRGGAHRKDQRVVAGGGDPRRHRGEVRIVRARPAVQRPGQCAATCRVAGLPDRHH